MKFIDLFAGLGGFHVGLSRLGHECVLAAEINPELRALYEKNFGMRPRGDVRDLIPGDIPDHDVLCAGFPCQPFSKAGEQLGFECPQWGDLFDDVHRILRAKAPTFFILENVPNLLRHDSENTWVRMRERLERLGYLVEARLLSPHEFGIPQVRKRAFIIGRRSGTGELVWPDAETARASILDILERNPRGARPVEGRALECLKAWQRFIKAFPKSVDFPCFPIWSAEFGATYPYQRTTPHAIGAYELGRFLGTHGTPLSGVDPGQRTALLPSYARERVEKFPDWKILHIRRNREFFAEHHEWIRSWLPAIAGLSPSMQKLEWNCKGEERDIWKYVIQFRASGVRVRRPTTAPSLVAVSTHVPIVAWERRYLTPIECARLQDLAELESLPSGASSAFRALGNAVNARVAERVARALLEPRGEVACGRSGATRSGQLVIAPRRKQGGP